MEWLNWEPVSGNCFMKKRAIWILLIVALIISYYLIMALTPFGDYSRIREGNAIVKKIEDYRTKYKRLPSSLDDVGIPVIDESNPAFYYVKEDSTRYILYFGKSLGESRAYHSDSGKWDDF